MAWISRRVGLDKGHATSEQALKHLKRMGWKPMPLLALKSPQTFESEGPFGGLASELGGFFGAFPWEGGVAEVAVLGGLEILGLEETEVVDDAFGGHVEAA